MSIFGFHSDSFVCCLKPIRDVLNINVGLSYFHIYPDFFLLLLGSLNMFKSQSAPIRQIRHFWFCLSVFLQVLHDRIPTSGLRVRGRAHLPRIRGDLVWTAELLGSGRQRWRDWLQSQRTNIKHKHAMLVRVRKEFTTLISDFWNHFHYLSRENHR